MLWPLLRHRRNLGRPEGARFHRDPAARGGIGAKRRSLLAGAPRRQRELERSADALADRERALAREPARPARAGRLCVGCRTVPRAWGASGPLEPHA